MNTKLAAVLFSSAFVVMGRESRADTFTTSPAACNQGIGFMSIYAGRNPTGQLSEKHWVLDHWTAWQDMSPASTPSAGSQPAAVSYPWNEVMYDGVCAQYGSSIKCYMMSNSGPTFTTPVTDASSSPALITILTGTQIRLVLFWINTAGQLRYREYHPASNFWNVPGTLPGAPADLTTIAATHRYADQNGHSYVMGLCGKTNGSAFKCVTRPNLTTNIAWEVAPGSYSGNPAVGFTQDASELDIHVVGRTTFDSQLWQTVKRVGPNTWANPWPIGGDLNSSPTITNWGVAVLQIYARAAFDNNFWNMSTDHNGFSSHWYPLF